LGKKLTKGEAEAKEKRDRGVGKVVSKVMMDGVRKLVL
jgi:hypothetical protein